MRERRKRTRLRPGVPLACAAALWLAAAGSGAEERGEPGEAGSPGAPVAVGDEGAARTGAAASARLGHLQIAVDPETGRLVPPTPEQARAMARELRRMLAAPADRAARHNDSNGAAASSGARAAVVGPQVLQLTLTRLRADGGRSTACVHGVAGVESALAAEAPASERER